MGDDLDLFLYISQSPNSLQPLNHATPRTYDTVPFHSLD